MFTPRYDESESDEVSNSESDEESEDGNAFNYEENTVNSGIAGCQGSPVLPEEDELNISISCRAMELEHLEDLKISTDKLEWCMLSLFLNLPRDHSQKVCIGKIIVLNTHSPHSCIRSNFTC